MTDLDKVTKLLNDLGIGHTVHTKEEKQDSREVYEPGKHVVLAVDMDLVDGRREHVAVFSFDEDDTFNQVRLSTSDELNEFEE